MKSFQPIDQTLRTGEFTLPIEAADRRPLGEELKSMFESLTAGPMPDRLLELADKLDDAFNRGELFEVSAKLDS